MKCLLSKIELDVMDLTTTAADRTVPASVTIADTMNTGQVAIPILSNTGDADLECFEVALGTITSGVGTLDICQTTTTICIKDNEIPTASEYWFG